jgi:hypothetical protein
VTHRKERNMYDWEDAPDHLDPTENQPWPCPRCGHDYAQHNHNGCHAIVLGADESIPHWCDCIFKTPNGFESLTDEELAAIADELGIVITRLPEVED